ncbi:hypothetical protein L6R52_12990 [Myxococcota bacterium]|nr:hypothetical protein [Myxococcota bacterium]
MVNATPGLYPARPTLLVEGEVETELSTRIRTLVVEEDADGLFRAEVTLENWGPRDGAVDFLYFDRRLLDFGKSMKVRLGAGSTEAEVFEGRISAIEGRFPKGRPPEILVLAEDRLQDLRMTRRTRSFEDVADRDLFERIAREHGLTPSIDVSGPTHRVIAQVNQSDLAFLRDRARSIGAELWVRGSTLHAKARSARSSRPVALTYGERLLSFSVTADLAEQRTSFSVTGWDPSNKRAVEEVADSTSLGAELGALTSGAELLERAFAARPERIVHAMAADANDARAIADASFRAMARRFVVGRGIAEGDGRITGGGAVSLSGLGALFDGDYAVVAVRHTYDLTDGLRTLFSVERPGVGS